MRYTLKHTKPNKSHFSVWVMRTAAALGCLTLMSAYLLSGVYAKFSATAFGEDSARVAKWDVSIEFTGEKSDFALVNKDGQKTAEYTFAVTSKSEVALSYDVIITLPEALPDTVTFKIEDATLTKSDADRVYTFTNVGSFAADGGTNSHTLEITSDFMHDSIALKGITVDVVATQND